MAKTIFRVFMVLFIFGSGILVSWNFFNAKPKQPQIASQVVINKIEEVCKLVTVEGFFTEEVEYKDESDFSSYMDYLLIKNYLPVRANLKVNATVMVGYDMGSIKIEAFDESNKIIVSNLPDPKILSVDHEVVYFEKDEWKFFNELTDADYVYLNKEAESQIRKAAEESELMDLANSNGNKMVEMMRFIAEASGWEFEIVGMDSIPQKNFDTFD
jgi:hypothetical protein